MIGYNKGSLKKKVFRFPGALLILMLVTGGLATSQSGCSVFKRGTHKKSGKSAGKKAGNRGKKEQAGGPAKSSGSLIGGQVMGIYNTPCQGPFGRANCELLPEQYTVYTGYNKVVNNPVPGMKKKILPTVNYHDENPGCYLACYSKRRENSVYGVGGGIFVMGQVRVSGYYKGRVCQPRGYEDQDVSAAGEFKRLCAESFPKACGQGCWAGGDTGGWFGIP